jgi:hypothetical protein
MEQMIAVSMFAYQKLGGQQLKRGRKAYVITLALLFTLCFFLNEKVIAGTILIGGALFFPFLTRLILFSVKKSFKKLYAKPEYQYAFAETHLELGKAGFKTEGDLGKGEYKWKAVLKLIELDDLWVISLHGNHMICVPKSALKTGEQTEEFKKFFEEMTPK